MKLYLRYLLHSFVKLEDLFTFFGRSWSHFGWRKFHNRHKCGRYSERTNTTPLKSPVPCNSSNIYTCSPLHPCLHVCTLTQCTHTLHPPTLTLGTLLFLQPVLHKTELWKVGCSQLQQGGIEGRKVSLPLPHILQQVLHGNLNQHIGTVGLGERAMGLHH